MATSQYQVLTVQVQAPLADPVLGVTNVLDMVNNPFLSLQQAMDTLRSVLTLSQPSLITLAADGTNGALAPQGTITYTAPAGAQTVTIAGLSVPGVPAAAATAALTATATAAAINASVAHQLVATAYIDPANPTVVIVSGKWPGIAQNSNSFLVSGTGAAASAATLGGSAVAPARAGVGNTAITTFGIGTPLFP